MKALLTVSCNRPEGEANLFLYRRHRDGILTLLNGATAGPHPSYHLYNPDHRLIYAINECRQDLHGRSGSIRTFRITSEGFQGIGEVPSGGDEPCFLIMDPQRRFLICTNYGGSSLSVLPLDTGGIPRPPVQVLTWEGRSIRQDRQEQPHPHSACFTPDGRYLLVPDLGCDLIRVIHWDNSETPLQEAAEMAVPVIPGSGPRMMAFIPGTNRAWVVNELKNSGVRFVYKPDSLEILEWEKEISLLPPAWSPREESTASHIYGAENFCLFSLRGPDLLARVTERGVDFCESGGRGPRFFLADPVNHRLYVAWQQSHRISEYGLSNSGGLELIGNPLELPEPTCMALIPEP
jgi:6-phosphogluconolactonase